MSGAYHASVKVICFESCVLYRRGVILCCIRGGFPLEFYEGGGWFAKWIVRFLIG